MVGGRSTGTRYGTVRYGTSTWPAAYEFVRRGYDEDITYLQDSLQIWSLGCAPWLDIVRGGLSCCLCLLWVVVMWCHSASFLFDRVALRPVGLFGSFVFACFCFSARASIPAFVLKRIASWRSGAPSSIVFQCSLCAWHSDTICSHV